MEEQRTDGRATVQKAVGVAIVCLILLILQHMVLNRLPLLGGRCKPAAAAVVCVSVLWGPGAGMVTGFFCGLFMDAMLPGEAFFTFFLSLAGLAAGFLTRLFLERHLGACLLWGGGLLLLMELLYVALFFWLTGRAGPMAFWQVGIRDALVTLAALPFVYLPLRILLKNRSVR